MSLPLPDFSPFFISCKSRKRRRRSEGACRIHQDEPDPDYKLFFENLRVDGKSYVFEITAEGSSSVRIKYEEEEHSGVSAVQIQPQEGHRASSSAGIGGAKKRRPRRSSGPNTREVSDLSMHQLPNGCIAGDPLVDDDYQTFLNHIEACEGLAVLKWRNNVSVVYEEEPRGNNARVVYEEEHKEREDVQEIDDGDVMITEDVKLGEENDVLEESEDHSYFLEIRQHQPSLFRSRLLSILREPFNRKEYESMLSHFHLRTPVVKYKHLRDISIPYSTRKLGYSYLDHYPDLAQRIESASDDCHRDLFLRGFFFWLKNLGYKDAFRPWVPALPQTSYVDLDSGDNNKRMFSLQFELSEQNKCNDD